MTFKLEKASEGDCSETVEINTIEDLKALSEKYTERPEYNFMHLILNFGATGDYPESEWKKEPTITIYDDYIE